MPLSSRFLKEILLLIKTNPYYENFGEVELTDENWLKLLSQISKKNIDLIIEPYDLESFKLCESTGFIQSYKIPASSLNERDLMSEVKITKKPVYIGIGGAKESEIKKTVSFFDKELVTLLTGFQNFPTKIEIQIFGKYQNSKKTINAILDTQIIQMQKIWKCGLSSLLWL